MYGYEIITYGGGEVLREVFNAVVVACGDSIFQSFLRISMTFAAAGFGYEMVTKRSVASAAKWFAMYYLTMQVLLAPKVTVHIIDRLEEYQATGNAVAAQPVANVPLGLAIFASFTSQIGDALTQLMEQDFSLPDDLRYSHTGTVMASKIVYAAKEFRITDPNFSTNIQRFVNQCVFYDVLLGKYSLQDLLSENDLWSFISTRTSPARSFVYSNGSSTQIITCQEGVTSFNQQWSRVLNETSTIFGWKLFPRSSSSTHAKAQFLSFLPLGYEYLTNMSASASTLLQQNLLANAIEDSMIHQSAGVNATAAVDAYAFNKAQQQKRSTYRTIGEMAAYWLPLMKNDFEAILYGAFLLVVGLSFFPFGTSILKQYVASLLWTQCWAPLYAILNLLMTIYAKHESIAAIQTASGAGLNLLTQNALAEVNQDMAALSGYLSFSIPYIAYGLVKGMGSTLTQLAQHISSVTQSAATTATTEAVSGNLSMGNVQYQNQNAFNTNSNHWDTSGRFAAGGVSMQMPSGSMVTQTADGQTVLDMSSSISKLNNNVHLNDILRSAATEQSEVSLSNVSSRAQGALNSTASSFRQLDEIGTHRAANESSGHNDSYSHNGGTSQSISTFSKLVDQFAHQHNISRDLSERVLAAVYLDSGKSGIGKVMEGVIGAGAKGEGSISHTWQNSRLYQHAKQFANEHNFSKVVDDSLRAVKEDSYRINKDMGSRYAENISDSIDSARVQRDEAINSLSRSEQYRNLASYSQEHAGSIDTNYSQQFLEYLQKQKLPGHSTSMNVQEAEQMLREDPALAQKYARQFVNHLVQDNPHSLISNHQISNPEQIKTHSEQNRLGVREFNRPAEVFERNKEEVLHKTVQSGLGDPNFIDESAKKKSNAFLHQTSSEIKEGEKNISEKGQAMKTKTKEHSH